MRSGARGPARTVLELGVAARVAWVPGFRANHPGVEEGVRECLLGGNTDLPGPVEAFAMIRINIATHTRSFGYRADRLWRDLKREADRALDPVLLGAILFLVGLVAVVLVPVRRAPSRLSVAASVLAVAATYLTLSVVCLGASPAWLAAVVVTCGAAFAHLVQAFPSDHGWWLCEVQEVALEVLDTLEPPKPG